MAVGRGTENQKKALDFFRKHYTSHDPFEPADLTKAAGWSAESTKACLSKHACVFTEKTSDGRYRVTQAFRRYQSWRAFRNLVTQSRRSTSYEYKPFDVVRIYEFLLPLSNEEHLKGALDTLFYEDTIRARLEAINDEVLHRQFEPIDGESREEYFVRLLKWLSEKLPGYSVYHVQGRFRASDLMTKPQAVQAEIEGERYLIDETTAVARFIFPCKNTKEADAVDFFFTELFVNSIKEVVSGEDQIWMVESGVRNRVHIWYADSE